MNRFFILALIAILCGSGAFAQDIIVLKNGGELRVTDIRITATEVLFNMYDFPPGETVSKIEKSRISMIRYRDGRRETFSEQPTQYQQYGNQQQSSNNAWESRSVSERKTEYQDGTARQYYAETETVSKTERNNPVSNRQDIITLKSGEDIQAIVLEVGETDVKYKKGDNPNGPSYTIRKSEIFMIYYANGNKDVFRENLAPAGRQQRSAVNQQMNPYNNDIYSQQQFPLQKYTFGKQISPYGSEKSQFLAGFLSWLIPGAGQFYNGDLGGGFLFMGCNIVCNSVWTNSIKIDSYGDVYITDETAFTIGLIGAFAVNISAIIHAAHGAKKVNIARGYRLGDNTYLKIQPTMIHQNNLLTGKDYAYGMGLCINF